MKRIEEQLNRLTPQQFAVMTGKWAGGRDPIKRDGYRHAAVLVPVLRQNEIWTLLFTRRRDNLQAHSGEVSFPGGAQEPGDHSLVDTALREAYEEIGLKRDNVRILGSLPAVYSVSGFEVTPILGVIENHFTPVLQESEVKRLFAVPISWLASEENYKIRPWQEERDGWNEIVYYKAYDGETVWGLTAGIVHMLFDILKA